MAHETLRQNPFMLMMHPDVVFAAVESSERLSQLNRHLCRPLDRQVASPNGGRDGDGGDLGRFADDDASDVLS